jgi:hypothetical protein
MEYTPFTTTPNFNAFLNAANNAKGLQALALAYRPVQELGAPYGLAVLYTITANKTNST